MPSTKTVLDRSPFYALVGAADLAVSTVRTSLESASAFRDELTSDQVQDRIVSTVNDVREQLSTIPALATERYEAVAGTVERAYDEVAKGYLELVQRGEGLTRGEESVEAPAAPAAPATPKPAAKPAAKKATTKAAAKPAAKRPARKTVAKKASAKKAAAKKTAAAEAPEQA